MRVTVFGLGYVGSVTAAALARDGLRHFPHWAERSMGLARGGGVSVEALLAEARAAEEAPIGSA